MGRFFSPTSLGFGGKGFLGNQPVIGGATLTLIVGGPASTGALDPPLIGDGTGFNTAALAAGSGQIGFLNGYDGSTGGNGPTAGGFTFPALGWTGANGGLFFVALQGTLSQNAFTSIALGPPANLNFLSAAATFDTADWPGFSVWMWADGNEFAFLGQTLDVTLS